MQPLKKLKNLNHLSFGDTISHSFLPLLENVTYITTSKVKYTSGKQPQINQIRISHGKTIQNFTVPSEENKQTNNPTEVQL